MKTRQLQTEAEKEATHIQVAETLDRVDYLRPKVIIGFVVFFALYLFAIVMTAVYFIM